MRSRASSRHLLAALALTALALAILAVPASAKRVAVGPYQAVPTVAIDQSYTLGVFSVIRSAGKRRIVADADLAGIYYPDAGECDKLDVPLETDSIAISATGRFRVSETAPVKDGSAITIDWRGRWSKPGMVAGSITIKRGGCTSTRRWTGGRVG